MVLQKEELKELKIKTIKDLQKYFIYYFQYALQKEEFLCDGDDNATGKVYDFLDKSLEGYTETIFYKKKDLSKIWCIFCLELIKADVKLKESVHLMVSIENTLSNMDCLDLEYLDSYLNNISMILNIKGSEAIISRLKFDTFEINTNPPVRVLLRLKGDFLKILEKYNPLEDAINIDNINLPVGTEETLSYQDLGELFFEQWCELFLYGITEIKNYIFAQKNKPSVKVIKTQLKEICDGLTNTLSEVIVNEDLRSEVTGMLAELIKIIALDIIKEEN